MMLGKIEGRRKRGWHRMRWLDGTTDSMDKSFSKFQKMLKDREDWYGAVHEVAKSWTWLNDWATTTDNIHYSSNAMIVLLSSHHPAYLKSLTMALILPSRMSYCFRFIFFLGSECSRDCHQALSTWMDLMSSVRVVIEEFWSFQECVFHLHI